MNTAQRLVIAALWLGVAPSAALAASLGTASTGGRSPAWAVLVAPPKVAGPSAHKTLGLSSPEGLAIDRRGPGASKWMYLADTGNNRVVKLGTGGRYLASWGRRGTGPGRFEGPTAVAVDGRGDVYVADTGNNRIQRFNARGRFEVQWGTKGPAPGQFDGPAAIAIGGSGNVFVADRGNQRIEKFGPSGRLLATWPVPLPTSSNPQGFGPAGPYALAVTRQGNVIAAVDTGQCSGGHCVMDYIVLDTFSPGGRVIRSAVGGNPYGPYTAVGGNAGPWWQIGALAIDPRGHLFLAEWNPQNRASITEFSATATTRPVGQWVLPPPTGGNGYPPRGIAIDPRGTLYVADTRANRLLTLSHGAG